MSSIELNMSSAELDELIEHAKSIRRTAIRMSYESGTSHVGCALSFADILAVLYFKIVNLIPGDPGNAERDRVILSKGHGVVGLYAALAERGLFPREVLDDYCRDGSRLASHIVRGVVPGAETSSGSGGHGLSLGIGMAIALRNQDLRARVFVLSGDGELEEGSVWEAVLFAGTHRLRNLVLVVDYNNLQDGTDGLRVDDILDLNPLDAKFESFGWNADIVDGHDLDALRHALGRQTEKPHVIIANTVQGKGVSYMENKGEWHGRVPNSEQYQIALRELV